MQSNKFSAARAIFAIFVTLLLASAIAPAQTQATKFKVVHTFHGKDGSFPTGTLVRDSAGNIYGTTSGGGTGGCDGYGCGTVFKMNKVGKEIWLYGFKGTNQIDPAAGLLRDAGGNLYGTTEFGGKITKTCGGVQGGGCGTVFKVDKDGQETALYKFKGTPDGYFPGALLVEDRAGDLYGTTSMGGAYGLGSVFKLNINDKEIILHSFSGAPDGGGDGAFPDEGVIRDESGDLFGVTFEGGAYGAGVVYKLDSLARKRCSTVLLAGRTGPIQTRCCSLILRGTSMERPRTAATRNAEGQAVAWFSNCHLSQTGLGQRVRSMHFVPYRAVRMGKVPSAHSFWTRPEISTV